MKKAWFDEIQKEVEKCFVLKIPYEIVHFPSTGVTSAITKISQIYKDEDNDKQIITIDFAGADFNGDNKDQDEINRILKTQIEQQTGVEIKVDSKNNIYKTIELIIREYIQQKKSICFVLKTNNKLHIEKVSGFNDLLIFLDRQRDYTSGAINILITSNNPLFNENNPSPMPLITQYFNYYNQGRLYRTFNEDIFLKKLSPLKINEIIEATNGLASLGKAIKADLAILNEKADKIDF